MCGIAGIVNFNGQVVTKDMIKAMTSVLNHRGPDDEGIYTFSEPSHLSGGADIHVGLGHKRLSIIDLSPAGHEPMRNEDGLLWMVCNGEIYNFKELRAELEKKGHRFSSNTDVEVILHLYEDFDVDCVKYLRGMFAFAIWDKINQRLFMARDRVGKKPLCYAIHNNNFIFASEIKALLQLDKFPRHVNKHMLDHYLTYGYSPSPDSIFDGVKKLQPAHYLVYDRSGVKVQQYWKLSYKNKVDLSEKEFEERFFDILDESVKLRLISDVPLGAFLSGGIDSSLITYYMAKEMPGNVKTFSIGFDEAGYSELEYAALVAKHFGTEHHEFVVKPNAMELLPKLVWYYDEPFGDSSSIPTYYVARETKKFVTVALNGDGGDESFGGYERYVGVKMGSYVDFVPSFVYKLPTALMDTVLRIKPNRALTRRRNFFDAMSRFGDYKQRYANWITFFSSQQKAGMYTSEFSSDVSQKNSLDFLISLIESSDADSVVEKIINADTMSYLPEDLLVKMDIAAMANSLEGRSPFLDHKVMEFAASMPLNLKIKGMTTKYLLRKKIASILPPKIANRKKMGFGIPIGHWFKGHMKDFLRETLLSDQALKRGYFNRAYISNILDEHASGKVDHQFRLWSLLNLELWHQIFIDKRS